MALLIIPLIALMVMAIVSGSSRFVGWVFFVFWLPGILFAASYWMVKLWIITPDMDYDEKRYWGLAPIAVSMIACQVSLWYFVLTEKRKTNG